MANSENSVPETTAITTLPCNIPKRVYIRYDPRYVRKKGGIIKILGILLGFLGFLSVQCTYFAEHPTGKWYTAVSMFGVWITGFLLFCYIFHFVEKFTKPPWTKFELFYCLIMALCYVIASIMALTIENHAFEAAAIFGSCAAVVYLIDAYLQYLLLKSGEPAQTEEIIKKEVVDDTLPEQKEPEV